MGIISKALAGAGTGVQQVAALNWEQMKADADREWREKEAEIERQYRTDERAAGERFQSAQTDKQIDAQNTRNNADNAAASDRQAKSDAAAMDRLKASEAGANSRAAADRAAKSDAFSDWTDANGNVIGKINTKTGEKTPFRQNGSGMDAGDYIRGFTTIMSDYTAPQGVRDQARNSLTTMLGVEGSGGPSPGARGTVPVGTVSGGYRFKGGNPNDEKNWEPVK